MTQSKTPEPKFVTLQLIGMDRHHIGRDERLQLAFQLGPHYFRAVVVDGASVSEIMEEIAQRATSTDSDERFQQRLQSFLYEILYGGVSLQTVDRALDHVLQENPEDIRYLNTHLRDYVKETLRVLATARLRGVKRFDSWEGTVAPIKRNPPRDHVECGCASAMSMGCSVPYPVCDDCKKQEAANIKEELRRMLPSDVAENLFAQVGAKFAFERAPRKSECKCPIQEERAYELGGLHKEIGRTIRRGLQGIDVTKELELLLQEVQRQLKSGAEGKSAPKGDASGMPKAPSESE